MGVIITTYSSSQNKEKIYNVEMDINRWVIGILMLSAGLILSSTLGNLQQLGNKKYGLGNFENKIDVNEDLFYNVNYMNINIASLVITIFLFFVK
jgi:hypothetical protein